MGTENNEQKLDIFLELKKIKDWYEERNFWDDYIFFGAVSIFVGPLLGLMAGPIFIAILSIFIEITNATQNSIVFVYSPVFCILSAFVSATIYLHKENKNIDKKLKQCIQNLSDDLIADTDINLEQSYLKIASNLYKQYKSFVSESENDKEFLNFVLEKMEKGDTAIPESVKKWVFMSVDAITEKEREAEKEQERIRKGRMLLSGHTEQEAEKVEPSIKIEEN